MGQHENTMELFYFVQRLLIRSAALPMFLLSALYFVAVFFNTGLLAKLGAGMAALCLGVFAYFLVRLNRYAIFLLWLACWMPAAMVFADSGYDKYGVVEVLIGFGYVGVVYLIVLFSSVLDLVRSLRKSAYPPRR